mmetsp:Transcript_28728/g.61663  ORF Transcript_28728/g.61663 Transcript_28728/m.61663 type:complete len:118 (-) Transcript_28728:376-729(-)
MMQKMLIQLQQLGQKLSAICDRYYSHHLSCCVGWRILIVDDAKYSLRYHHSPSRWEHVLLHHSLPKILELFFTECKLICDLFGISNRGNYALFEPPPDEDVVRCAEDHTLLFPLDDE